MGTAAGNAGQIMPADGEVRRVHVNGIDLHVVLAGAGEPLLLLHGFPDSAKLWRTMIPLLVAAGFRVIAPDQRGFGESSAPADVAAYAIDTIVADAVALLDALGIACAGLIGHDWGAIIGWRLIADHPDRFTRFVALTVGHPNALAAAGWRQRRRSWYVTLFRVPWLAETLLRANNFRNFGWMTGETEVAGWRRDLARPARLTAALNWYRANFARLLDGSFPRARIPVLGIIGTADVALTVGQMTDSGRFVDAAFTAHVLPGAGHWLPLHAADAVAALALPFLTPAAAPDG